MFCYSRGVQKPGAHSTSGVWGDRNAEPHNFIGLFEGLSLGYRVRVRIRLGLGT